MPLRPELILAHDFGAVRHSYTVRDAILYALGVGLGRDPLDEGDLPFLDETRLAVLPTYAVTLASPGMWMRRPEYGVDFRRLVHLAQAAEFHMALPPSSEIVGSAKVVALSDRGEGRGAVLDLERRIAGSGGVAYCTLRQTLLLRGDGGFGGPRAETRRQPLPNRAPDLVAEVATSARAALIYRLSGDWNPLHLDPGFARAAGFERPILQGLASYATAGVAVARALGRSPADIAALSCRFSGVVYPGETLAFDIWREEDGAAFRANAGGRPGVGRRADRVRRPPMSNRGAGCEPRQHSLIPPKAGMTESNHISSERHVARELRARLRLPIMAGPMFIASTADLVIAQCKAGIIGAMPALNPRSTSALDEDVARIREAVGERPYCINLVAHRTNERLQADLEVVLRHKVPIVVLALAANGDLVRELQANGALVFQDVIKERHARKCAEMGVDGIIAVAAGAGGHTGDLSPFALMQELREWWNGLLILSGCIATGRAVLAAETLGADLAYVGSPFLASTEANTSDAFKRMLVEGKASDIAVANCFTGVNANFLLPSILQNGVDPSTLQSGGAKGVNISGGGPNARAWRDIWSAGQGIGAIKRSEPACDYIDWLAADYARARAEMGMSA